MLLYLKILVHFDKERTFKSDRKLLEILDERAEPDRTTRTGVAARVV